MSDKEMTFKERLLKVQIGLKAPKNQLNDYNKSNKYRYRKAEDILEAVKPLAEEYNIIFSLDDEIVFIEGRFYVKATAIAEDISSDAVKMSHAYAREGDSRVGMDVAQVTGASSSYARKYALGGLLNIDDSDIDPDANASDEQKQKASQGAQSKPTQAAKSKSNANVRKQTNQPAPPVQPEQQGQTMPEPPAQPEQPEAMTFCCDVCGKPFESFTTKDGQVYTPAVQYALCRGKSPDGVVRCIDCRNKMLAEQKQ